MSEWFDDISRIVGNSIPRRQALKLIGSTLAGITLSSIMPRKAGAHDSGGEICGCCVSGGECRMDVPANECTGSCTGEAAKSFCVCADEQCTCCAVGQVSCCGIGGCICCDSGPGKGCISPGGVPECVIGDMAIELRSFTAEAHADGTTTIEWETATEVGNVGFNLYRDTAKGGPYVKINAALIPAECNAISGAGYRFVDTPGSGTFRYLLVNVDYNGINTLHGPVAVRVRRH